MSEKLTGTLPVIGGLAKLTTNSTVLAQDVLTSRAATLLGGTKSGLNYTRFADNLILSLDSMNPNSYPGTGSTWYDLSGRRNHGVIVNSPQYNNGLFTFVDTGSQYVSCGNFGNTYDSGTISLWGYATVIKDNPNIFSTKYSGGNDCIRFEINGSGVLSGGFALGGGAGTFTSSLKANTWFNLVFTWSKNSNSCIGYLNGTQVFESFFNPQTQFPTTMPSITIGEGFSVGRYWSGGINDIQIYNTALPQTNILQNYTRTLMRNKYAV